MTLQFSIAIIFFIYLCINAWWGRRVMRKLERLERENKCMYHLLNRNQRASFEQRIKHAK